MRNTNKQEINNASQAGTYIFYFWFIINNSITFFNIAEYYNVKFLGGKKMMDPILIFFVLPLATVIVSIALQKILNNPLLVGALVFAVLLVASYLSYNGASQAIVVSILFGIIAFLAAYLTKLLEENNNNSNNSNNSGSQNNGCPSMPICRPYRRM